MIDSLYQRWYFPRPALAKQILSVLTQGTGDPLALIGERRIGKTSHLRAELVEHAQANGYVAVYIDIRQHRTPRQTAIRLLKRSMSVYELSCSTMTLLRFGRAAPNATATD
jgi:AAA+ ATPase superfamily predicted ATPase